MHLSAVLYEALEKGELSRELLREIEREHLVARCPVCAEALAAYEAGLPTPARGAAKLSDPLEVLRRRRGLSKRQLQHEERTARKWVRKLVRKVPAAERCSKVRGAYKLYRGSVFGVLLLEEARRAIPGNPAKSLSLAEAALASCEKTHPEDPDPQVRVPALAIRGNALRALGQLRQADGTLREAARLLDNSDLDDLLVAAEIDRYLGSLRTDQLRLGEACRHLERASLLYRLIESTDLAAVTFIKLGMAHYYGHSYDAAVSSAQKALDILGREPEPWLEGYALYNLALFLHGRGETDRAAEELAAHQAVIEAAGERLVFRAGWLRGRIAWSREELAAADRHFRQAISWARGHGFYFEAGLISLERALVHLARGRTDRVRKLATEALALFAREEQVERETRAALEVLEAAAQHDALTQKTLEQAVATLDGARHRHPVVESPAQ